MTKFIDGEEGSFKINEDDYDDEAKEEVMRKAIGLLNECNFKNFMLAVATENEEGKGDSKAMLMILHKHKRAMIEVLVEALIEEPNIMKAVLSNLMRRTSEAFLRSAADLKHNMDEGCVDCPDRDHCTFLQEEDDGEGGDDGP